MVYIQTCASYEKDLILQKVHTLFEAHGGIGKFAGPNKKVVIKPNLVGKKKPEAAATTHPSLVWAVAKLCRDQGAEVVIAESPGGLYEKGLLKGIYRATGMEEAAADSGAALNYDLSEKAVKNDGAMYLRSLELIAPVAEADVVINISKLKTHGMMVYTGAVKNMFGTIAGLKKAEYHMNMSDYDAFANSIIDIYLASRPALNIIDAVVGMERDGPTAGDPKQMNLLLSGEDGFATDLAALAVIGVDPQRVPVLKNAIARGLCPPDWKTLSYPGLSPEEASVSDFIVNYNEQLNNLYFLPGIFGKWFSGMLSPRPVFHKDKCRSCGECAKCCPAKVITVSKGRCATADLKKCIRCYCCQELCPFQAVSIRKPILNKILIHRKKDGKGN